jgi:RHS repeat-associated protein
MELRGTSPVRPVVAQRYLYNGKELVEGIGLYDYGARWYDPVVGRWTSVDPLAGKMPGWSPYNYVLGNPILNTDPDGMQVESPIFDHDGNFLGVDSEGYKGDVVVMRAETYNAATDNGKQVLDHTVTKNLVEAGNPIFASKLNEADLTPEAYSKILTNVLGEMSDVNTSELLNGAVSVLDRNRNARFNDPVNVLGLAETTVTDGGIKVAANLYTGTADSDLNTVENIQNNLGAHEFIGHGKKGWGDKTRTHHKVYDFQMRHSIWKNTTGPYKTQMEKYRLDYLSREK